MKKKLQQARVADATRTDRIFFDNGGLNAWIAYFLATEGKAHFKGTISFIRYYVCTSPYETLHDIRFQPSGYDLRTPDTKRKLRSPGV